MDSRWLRLWDFTEQVQRAAGVDGKSGMFAWKIHVPPNATTEYSFDMSIEPLSIVYMFQHLKRCLRQQRVLDGGCTVVYFFCIYMFLEKN